MLFVVGWLLVVARCSLFVVCGLLFALSFVCCVSVVVRGCLLVVGCFLVLVGVRLVVVGCLLFVVVWLLVVDC